MRNYYAKPKRNDFEHQLQVSLFAWMFIQRNKYRGLDLAYSTGSGLRLPIGLRVKACKAGVIKKGLPDVVIPAARRGYHGLYIELKSEDGTTSKDQIEFIRRLNEENYLAVVCYSFKEVTSKIEWYFS